MAKRKSSSDVQPGDIQQVSGAGMDKVDRGDAPDIVVLDDEDVTPVKDARQGEVRPNSQTWGQ
jgi:hypothetical protein